MKRILTLFAVIGIVLYGLFQIRQVQPYVSAIETVFTSVDLINKKGDSISTRVKIPKGYEQIEYAKGSFREFIQNYPLKPFGAKVINYDGSDYFYQSGHVGVLKLSVPKNGLQQCADALIRLRAEYLWKTNQKSKIGFEFTSGHYCSWQKYAEGYRPKIKGNKVSFHKTARKNHTKQSFYNYLNLIYMYSGTLSLHTELPKVTEDKNLKVGDMLVYPGTPGHIVMIVNKIKNNKGEKRFLLAQGNTPAQSVHILKNPNEENYSPWYALESNMYLEIPGYYFERAVFIRFKDL